MNLYASVFYTVLNLISSFCGKWSEEDFSFFIGHTDFKEAEFAVSALLALSED